MAKKKGGDRKPPTPAVSGPSPVSDAEAYAQVEKVRQIVSYLKFLTVAIAVPVSFLALWPLAIVLGGRETVVNVNIAISLSIAFAVTTAGAGGVARQQRKKAEEARKRVSKLETELLTTKAELKAASERQLQLEGDLQGVRMDLVRARGRGE